MKIIKWYSIILVTASLIRDLYKSGKDNESFWVVTLAVLLEMPIIVYLILS